jgi:hypothetical protein
MANESIFGDDHAVHLPSSTALAVIHQPFLLRQE